MMEKKILVLGVGNILLRDEGIGVRVVEKLEKEYRFSSNVELMDGGTLGMRLVDPVYQSDYVIVVDAVQNGEVLGTVYRLSPEDLNKRLKFNNSLHQLDLVEALVYAEMLGKRPDAVIIGIEPADISPWGTEMTETIEARLPEMCLRVLDEIEKAGGSYTAMDAAAE